MTAVMDEVVTPQAVREAGEIIPIDQAKEILARTEPLGDVFFQTDGTSKVKVDMPREWNEDQAATELMEGPEKTLCSVTFSETDEPVFLSKDALLKLSSEIGLNRAYVQKTPGPLVAVHLNWWLNHNGVRGTEAMHLLTKDGYAVAARKDGLESLPNLPLIERVEDRLHAKYGSQELMVDSKFHHDLRRTALRIIVPDSGRTIERSARHSVEKPDRWSVGVQFVNSLMGDPAHRLELSGYLFAWWCTNGAITTHGNSGKFNRRSVAQDLDTVADWTSAVTDQALSALDPALDDVESLLDVDLDGELREVLGDVFNTYHMPPPLRPFVTEHLINSDDLSGYGLMQAITQTANMPTVSDTVAQTVMTIGGQLPHTITERCGTCHRALNH